MKENICFIESIYIFISPKLYAIGENLRGAEDAALSEDIVAAMSDDIAEPQDRRLDSDDFNEDEKLSDDFEEEDDEDRLLAEMPDNVSLAEDGGRRLGSCFSRNGETCCRRNGNLVCTRKRGGRGRTVCRRRNGRTVCKRISDSRRRRSKRCGSGRTWRNGRCVKRRRSRTFRCTKRTRSGRCKLTARQKVSVEAISSSFVDLAKLASHT